MQLIRVLGLSSYPVEAAATRFRLAQFVEPLSQLGIELNLSPFLQRDQFLGMYRPGGALRKLPGLTRPLLDRFGLIAGARKFDLIFVQREAMFFGPGIFEFLYRAVGRVPMVLDLDDATYVSYVSPSYGKLGSYFKFFGKTDKLVRASRAVTCGNRFIAQHVESLGVRAVVIPTVVSTDAFHPVDRANKTPVLGWIGTHSTFPFLESLFPVLERLATKHHFELKIVGSGKTEITLKGIRVVNVPWELHKEIGHFQSIDIGLYPMTLSDSANQEWLQGKSGFKAIQYMAVGIPFVMSPVGVATEIGESGVTHFNAEGSDDWYTRLEQLLSDEELCSRMGNAGRRHSLDNFTIQRQAELLAKTLKEACRQN